MIWNTCSHSYTTTHTNTNIDIHAHTPRNYLFTAIFFSVPSIPAEFQKWCIGWGWAKVTRENSATVLQLYFCIYGNSSLFPDEHLCGLATGISDPMIFYLAALTLWNIILSWDKGAKKKDMLFFIWWGWNHIYKHFKMFFQEWWWFILKWLHYSHPRHIPIRHQPHTM